MSILSHFSGTPRLEQQYALEEIEKDWHKYDVFVVDSPVAVGKSRIGAALAEWAGNAAILTPTNILVDQYEDDFPEFCYLRRKSFYPCKFNHKECKKKLKACRECEYKRKRQELLDSKVGVMNYYMFIAMRKNYNFLRSTIIIDEAQNLIPTLTDLASLKIWKHKYSYPNNMSTEGDILEWIYDSGLYKQKRFKPVINSLQSTAPDYRFERTSEYWYKKELELIKCKPISVKNYKPILWPWCTKKIVLMSATISYKDIEELGLDRRRVKYIQTGSPIPPTSRPVVYTPLGSFSFRKQHTSISKAVDFIRYALDNYSSKGIIHTTYQVSNRLREQLDHPRIIWHDRENKRERYREFRRRKDNCVLIACGLSEGIDITNDYGRWQLILKLPYPSLADTAVSTKAQQDPEWYRWQTIKTILQASGRICRHPEDFGLTMIMDNSFAKLYLQNKHLFPQWFRDSLVDFS